MLNEREGGIQRNGFVFEDGIFRNVTRPRAFVRPRGVIAEGISSKVKVLAKE